MPAAVRTLEEFLATLDEWTERVPLDVLTQRLGELEISLDDVRRFVRFGRQTYRRNLMHAGPGYQALILCWRPGQRSPIHDHRGSSCGVRVLAGIATETLFERTLQGLVFPTQTRRHETGSVCGSQDSDLHQMSNLEPPGNDLVTLHIYSPALLRMGMYSLTSAHVGEFLDPVMSFMDGDGI